MNESESIIAKNFCLNMVRMTKENERYEKDCEIIDSLRTNNIVLSTQMDGKSTQYNSPTEGNLTDMVKSYSCLQCSESFLNANDFETHLKTHKEEENTFKQTSNSKQYCCSHCFKTFSTLTYFIVHQQIHRGEGGRERPYGCSQCGKRFYREDGLKKHQQSHVQENSHCCPQCGKSFFKKSLLTSHRRTHVKEGFYRCTVCNLSFAGKYSYEKHVQIHFGHKLFHCFQCGKSFLTENSLNKHKHRLTGKSPFSFCKQIPLKKKSYSCSHCGKTFASLSYFMVHQQIHKEGKGERPFSCTKCGKAFYREKGLKVHEQNHTEKRPSPCSDCAKLSTSKRNTSKQYDCSERPSKCDKSHHGERQTVPVELTSHTCSYCGRTFATDLILQKHLESHERTSAHYFTLQDPNFAEQNSSVLPGDVQKKTELAAISKGCCFVITNSESTVTKEKRPMKEDDVCLEDTCDPVLQNFTGSSDIQEDEMTKRQVQHLTEADHSWLEGGETQVQPQTVCVDFCKETLECNLNSTCHQTSKPETKLLVQVKTEYSNVQEDCQPKMTMSDKRKLEEKGSDGQSAVKEMATEITESDMWVKEEPSVEEPTSNPQSDESCTQLLNLMMHRQISTEDNVHHGSEGPRKQLRSVNPVTFQKSNTNDKHRSLHRAARKKAYCCIKCGRIFGSTTNYIVHLQIHRRDGKEERPFSCSQCGKSFYKEEGLKKHQISHTGKRQRRLSAKVRSERPVSSHRYVQTGERPYKSTNAVGSLATKNDSRKCVPVQGGHKLGICSSENGLKKPKTVFRRERSSNAEEKKSYHCTHCGKTFSVLTNYIVHQQIHRGDGKTERPFVCLVCGKRFYREQGLRTHQETHASERAFYPSQPDKALQQKSLTEQAQIQAGEGPLSCFCCEKTFDTDSGLIHHLKLHSLQFKAPDLQPTGAAALGQTQSVSNHLTNPALMDDAETEELPQQTCSTVKVLRSTSLELGQNQETDFFCGWSSGKRGKASPASSDNNSWEGDAKPSPAAQPTSKIKLTLTSSEIKEEDNEQKCLEDTGVAEWSLLKIIKVEDVRHTTSLSVGDVERSHAQVQSKPAAQTGHVSQGQKTYCCTQCGKHFGATTSYLVHLQIHRGKRPFSCAQCGKSYYKEDGLKAHQQTHITGI